MPPRSLTHDLYSQRSRTLWKRRSTDRRGSTHPAKKTPAKEAPQARRAEPHRADATAEGAQDDRQTVWTLRAGRRCWEPAHARLVPGVGRVAQPPLLLVQVGDERAQVLRAPPRAGSACRAEAPGASHASARHGRGHSHDVRSHPRRLTGWCLCRRNADRTAQLRVVIQAPRV